MIRNLWAIAGNTFTETLRQPVYGVVIGAATFLLVMGPSLSMFTIDDDNKLLRDTALSTLLVAGLFLAVFAAATVVHGEIENKTALTVVTKTVDRYTFILGKFLGISSAVILGQTLLSIILLMVVRHGALQRASDIRDTAVITLGLAAGAVTVLVGGLGNYFYRWRFTTTAVVLGTIACALALAGLYFIDAEWQYNPAHNNLDFNLLGPIALAIMASVVLTSIAVAAATRVGLVMTLTISSLAFVLGISLQPWLSPIAGQQSWLGYVCRGLLAIVPSLNFYVATNALYQGLAVPTTYLLHTLGYGLLYVAAVLMFTMALFRSREIG